MKTILSISGGGIRGVVPAAILTYIEKIIAPRRCVDVFDFITGNSTGGIIALALAQGMPAADILKFYLTRSQAIFTRSTGYAMLSLGGFVGPKYQATELESELKTLLPNLFAQNRTRVMVPAYDLLSRQPWFFKSWDNSLVRNWQVARATSAAPTLFPPVN
jgi:uncharacterized protein